MKPDFRDCSGFTPTSIDNIVSCALVGRRLANFSQDVQNLFEGKLGVTIVGDAIPRRENTGQKSILTLVACNCRTFF